MFSAGEGCWTKHRGGQQQDFLLDGGKKEGTRRAAFSRNDSCISSLKNMTGSITVKGTMCNGEQGSVPGWAESWHASPSPKFPECKLADVHPHQDISLLGAAWLALLYGQLWGPVERLCDCSPSPTSQRYLASASKAIWAHQCCNSRAEAKNLTTGSLPTQCNEYALMA